MPGKLGPRVAIPLRSTGVCLVALMVLDLLGCSPPGVSSHLHYVLGAPYNTHGVWWYPAEDYALQETGLAAVVKNDQARLTTDGEVFDQNILAAAHPTIQLPAIAQLTNLETGAQVTVRINDRGSGDPRRLVEVTHRAAELLGIEGVARVRLRVLANESRAASDSAPGHPTLQIDTVPRGTVDIVELPPPAGIRRGAGHVQQAVEIPATALSEQTPPPLRLPELVMRTKPAPGNLMVRLDTFEQYRYAKTQCAKVVGASARIVPITEDHVRRFRVEIGPLPNVPAADEVITQALASGIPDARIVVD
jgi:rare lipoprotein A